MRGKRDDEAIVAWAEPASGPGWSNQPIWVVLKDRNGKLRLECIQPDEHSPAMGILYGISAAVHRAMLAAVKTRRRAPEEHR